jgi:regulator of RNase E activity RraA
MANAGFKVIARRLCVAHAYSSPVRWDCPVEVFGRTILPGQLIHADKHGFLAVQPDEERGLLEAARFLDSLECQTMIACARDSAGQSLEEVLPKFEAAAARYRARVQEQFSRKG